jgi:hypothetical protein
MNDFDLTDLMERIVSDYWNALTLFDGRPQWNEVPVLERNALKEQVLPWIFRAEPLITAKTKADVNRFIREAREGGLTDTEIVDQLALESNNA